MRATRYVSHLEGIAELRGIDTLAFIVARRDTGDASAVVLPLPLQG